MDFEQGLKTELSTITGLSGKIFPLQAPEGTAAPYLTHELGNVGRLRDLNNHTGDVNAQYQLDIYHNSYSTLKSLKKSIITKLKAICNKNIAVTGPYIDSLTILNEFETYEEAVKLHHGIIEIEVSFNEEEEV